MKTRTQRLCSRHGTQLVNQQVIRKGDGDGDVTELMGCLAGPRGEPRRIRQGMHGASSRRIFSWQRHHSASQGRNDEAGHNARPRNSVGGGLDRSVETRTTLSDGSGVPCTVPASCRGQAWGSQHDDPIHTVWLFAFCVLLFCSWEDERDW